MNSEAFEALSGVKVVTLVCALIGGALGISYAPNITPRIAISALFAAIVCGGFGPGLLEWAFNWRLPSVVSNMIAVILGIGGIFIVPGIIAAWQDLIRDPVAFVGKLGTIFDRLRAMVGGNKGNDGGNKGGDK